MARTGFSTLDWLVLGGYFAGLAALGIALSRKQSGTEEYFLGGRRMPAWAVALSVVATAISAATFIGAPAQSYGGDLTYLSATIGQFLAILVVAFFFIPVYYRERTATVYQLIGTRYGDGAKQACSWMFMVGRVFANGARLFMAALAGSRLVFGDTSPGHLILGVALITVVGIAYTLVGGIRAIIWTEVVQTVVLVGAAVAAIALLAGRIPVSTSQIIQTLASAKTAAGSPKTLVLDSGIHPGTSGLGIDFARPYTLLTAVLCWTVFNLAAYGTDHDLAQRMLTCRSAAKGSQSAIGAIVIGLPITALFMIVGLLLYIFYDRRDVMGGAWPGPRPGEGRDVFLEFIITQTPRGLAGLMMAGLFAAALSSLSSALNAMAATFVNDVYKRARPDRDERQYLLAGRVSMAGWGLILGTFGCLCIYWQQYNAKVGDQTLIDFALGVMNFAYSGLAAVFCTAIFTRRGNGASAIAALATGFIVVLLFQPAVYHAWAQHLTWTRYAPEGTGPTSLATVKIAGPWHLLIAFILATSVCALGKRSEAPRD